MAPPGATTTGAPRIVVRGAVAVELLRQLVEGDVVAALAYLEDERIATARARKRIELAAESLAGAVADVVDPVAARGLGHRDREPLERHSEPPRAVCLLDRAHLLGERRGEHIELDQDVGNRAREGEQQHDDPDDDRASLRWAGTAHLRMVPETGEVAARQPVPCCDARPRHRRGRLHRLPLRAGGSSAAATRSSCSTS